MDKSNKIGLGIGVIVGGVVLAKYLIDKNKSTNESEDSISADYVCEICGESFNTPEGLETHMENHVAPPIVIQIPTPPTWDRAKWDLGGIDYGGFIAPIITNIPSNLKLRDEQIMDEMVEYFILQTSAISSYSNANLGLVSPHKALSQDFRTFYRYIIRGDWEVFQRKIPFE
jgi:hypothetical protein